MHDSQLVAYEGPGGLGHVIAMCAHDGFHLVLPCSCARVYARRPHGILKRPRVLNQSINVKFVGRRYTRRPGAPTVVSGTHDQKVHS